MCEGKVFQYERDKIFGRERIEFKSLDNKINERLCVTPQVFRLTKPLPLGSLLLKKACAT